MLVEDILLEIAKVVGGFFINPLLYVGLFMAIILGYARVKRERKFFHRRIMWGWSEFFGSLKEGLLPALLISILVVVIGIVLPVELLQIFVVVSIIGLLSYCFYLLSPGVLFPIAFFLFMLVNYYDFEFEIFQHKFNVSDYDMYSVAIILAIFMGLLLIAEGLLIQKHGAKFASPVIESTKRGKNAVAYSSKKLWLLPLLLIVPGQLVENYFPYWPQFSLGYEQFTIVLFPMIIGFQQTTRKTLPIFFYYRVGRAITIFGEIVMMTGLVSYFVPILSIVVIALTPLVRIIISIIFRIQQKRDVYVVSPKSNGVSIVAVLPDSPAMKMGLKQGEVITKVNGKKVHSEKDLYEALQRNAAHCKIEVLDYNNEIRLTQHVVYSHDHFRIGLLVAK